jgi:UDP-2,3-diacylglucosamine hydrolase
MHSTLFISDLHLSAKRPSISALFQRFLETSATGADSLYILGDLFDHWVGDDQLDHDFLGSTIASALKRLAISGTKLFLMHGNRDFMLGARFAETAGLALLPDPVLIDLYGKPFLLLHGDTLCTDDVAYQRFRRQSRDQAWQRAILAKPYAERLLLAQSIRNQSESEKSGKTDEIMDVSADSVDSIFRQYGYPGMIHGHTHRPALHHHLVDGHRCERWVLADWHERGQFIFANENGCRSAYFGEEGPNIRTNEDA